LFNGCMNATVTAKHEYYITYIYSLIGVFRPFANLSPPFRGLSPLQQKYTSISANVTRILKVSKSLAWILERLPCLPMSIYIYDGLSKCLCLVWLINRNSMHAASYLNLKHMTYLTYGTIKRYQFTC
jgi:hypothetical protein